MKISREHQFRPFCKRLKEYNKNNTQWIVKIKYTNMSWCVCKKRVSNFVSELYMKQNFKIIQDWEGVSYLYNSKILDSFWIS